MTAPRDRLTSSHALLSGVVLAALAGTAIALWVLLGAQGWDYYRTPLGVRGYHEVHRVLRPSGPGGHLLGITGTIFLISTLFYIARKRLRFLAKRGSIPRWLEVHVFFGVFGPILITLHTSMKFNGLISVAYWSMTLVVFSGFIGRSLYIRIPKTIRGNELSRSEIEQRAAELKTRLDDAAISPVMHAQLDHMDHPEASLLARTWGRWREESEFRNGMRAAGVAPELVAEVLDVARERTRLMRSVSRLEKRRKLFQIWHVFHRPLVWVMFLILFVHVTVAIYFGYTIFG